MSEFSIWDNEITRVYPVDNRAFWPYSRYNLGQFWVHKQPLALIAILSIIFLVFCRCWLLELEIAVCVHLFQIKLWHSPRHVSFIAHASFLAVTVSAWAHFFLAGHIRCMHMLSVLKLIPTWAMDQSLLDVTLIVIHVWWHISIPTVLREGFSEGKGVGECLDFWLIEGICSPTWWILTQGFQLMIWSIMRFIFV